MHTFLDSKLMARSLRAALAEGAINVTHSDSLELVARQFGFADWNMLSARIEGAGGQLRRPKGWLVTGAHPELYRLGLDSSEPGAVRIERLAGTGSAAAAQFATLMQSIDATEFADRRLRFSAELRTQSAGKGALWMRVDPASGGRSLSFDNMHRRAIDGPLEGDRDWTRLSASAKRLSRLQSAASGRRTSAGRS